MPMQNSAAMVRGSAYFVYLHGKGTNFSIVAMSELPNLELPRPFVFRRRRGGTVEVWIPSGESISC